MAFSRFLAATSSTLPRQCLSGGVLFCTGDVIAQQVIEKKGSSHDIPRTLRLGLYGGAIFSPIAAVWLGKVLERVPYKGTAGVISKVALDQFVAAPNMTALFFTATTLMAGGSGTDVKDKLNDAWWPTLKTGWAVWIPVQAINMAIVPPPQRLLFVNVVSIFWNTFLSVMSGSNNTGEIQLEDEVELVAVKADKIP